MIDEVLEVMNKQKDKHYRMISLEAANLARKRYKGYNPITTQDIEVKGTALEKFKDAEGHIRIGNLVLASTSKEQFAKNRGKVQERTDRKLRSIKRTYQETGENIKRQLGSAHAGFKTIHKTED